MGLRLAACHSSRFQHLWLAISYRCKVERATVLVLVHGFSHTALFKVQAWPFDIAIRVKFEVCLCFSNHTLGARFVTPHTLGFRVPSLGSAIPLLNSGSAACHMPHFSGLGFSIAACGRFTFKLVFGLFRFLNWVCGFRLDTCFTV